MDSALQLTKLPNLPLPQREHLPACPAVYFALDSNDRVLYIGKAKNLWSRWQNHHRLEQLTYLHKRAPVRLCWLDLSDRIEQLDAEESYYIELYRPLLNRTKVPVKKVIPAETTLQQTLRKIAPYCLIFGIAPASGPHSLPTLNIRYLGLKPLHLIRRILKASNQKATNLRWTEFIQRKHGSWWRTRCNGVAIELGPWALFESTTAQPLVDEARIQALAGVEMRALQPFQLQTLLKQFDYLEKNYPDISALAGDPVPLLWTSAQQTTSAKVIPSSSTPNTPMLPGIEKLFIGEPTSSSPQTGVSKTMLRRQFVDPTGVEVEVCISMDGQLLIRHHLYWKIVHNKMYPDIEQNCVIDNLKNIVNHKLSTIRWVGCEFRRTPHVVFDDGMEVNDVILLPLRMFEDLIRFHGKQFNNAEHDCPKLAVWLQSDSVEGILEASALTDAIKTN
ncbi:GIY-YIG nuclease family protein [Cyanobacteria bacterium FACHB-502]|nr:GIY-YIG nuclease family protein [Cyanobacteria bacterium FACHB-502]